MRDLSHVPHVSHVLLSRVLPCKVIVRVGTWDFLIAYPLELHLEAFVSVKLVFLQVFSEIATIPLQVWV